MIMRKRGLFGRRSHLLRRLHWTSLVAFLWANRRDPRRWLDFARRAARQWNGGSVADLATEAKVRWAVSRDPFLRSSDAIGDVRVEDGIVTVLTTSSSWPDPRDRATKLTRVSGVSDVTFRPAVLEAVDPSSEAGASPIDPAFAAGTATIGGR